MREQVIPQKVGNRSGLAGQRRSSGTTQRPARRESGSEALAIRLRALLGYVPRVLKFVIAIVVGVLLIASYRAAASASFFQVRRVEVEGAVRVTSAEVQAIVRKEAEKTGVWKADLNGISARLERLPWIRSAVVSRVLPDGLRVRITERVPRAVVRTASGRFRWIDDDAVLLGEMLPRDQMPAFFLRGLNEEDPEGARQENRDRVAKFLELQRDWELAGLSERVSEVNLIDLRDVRAQLAGDNSQIEVRLGSEDQGQRLKHALEVLDGQRQSPQGALISYIDLSQGKGAIVGLTSGVHKPSDNLNVVADTPESTGETISDSAETVKPGVTAPRMSASKAARTAQPSSPAKKSDKAKQDRRNR
ncbi:MAG: cell division protein FtsQ [Pyrinomonadaceae bacterium]|nr:cell division protein FtsQ [Pyrinomonadaceae bacterium]